MRFPLAAFAALLTAMVTIQSGASLAKSLFPLVGAEGATALRLGFAAGILLIVFRPWRTRIARASLPSLLVYGVALSGMNLLFYMSLRTLPLAVAVGLEFSGPLGLAIARSRRHADVLWAAFGLAGILLLSMAHGLKQLALDVSGTMLALGAGACWAMYIAFGKLAARTGGQATVAYGTTIAAMITVPIGVAHAGGHLVTLHILPLAIAVALLTSAIPYSLEIFALQRIPVPTFGVLMSLEPVVAAVSGALILGERLEIVQIVGIVLIISASIGVIGSFTNSTSQAV